MNMKGWLVFAFPFVLSGALIACDAGSVTIGGVAPAPAEQEESPADASQIFKVFGLNFSPYVDGQDPNLGSPVDEGQLLARMEIIAPYTEWIRIFGSSLGLEKSGAVAHSLGLKAAMGAWIGPNRTANEREIENLISAAKAGEADMLIVGSEVLLRGDLSEAEVIDYINRVKQAVPELPVSYADTYATLLSHPNIIDAVDVVLANYYPYWEGIHVEAAVAAIHQWHSDVVAASNGKQVIVSETGWPSDGDTIGRAVPSPENAAYFFLNFVSWAKANNVEYFYFEAFDETWKSAYEGPQGAHWGIWDKDGNLKPGMEAVFNGAMMGNNWSETVIPGGPGEAIIEFTEVPPLESFEDLEGQVWHVDPSSYQVAVYIYVRGWWTKPTFAEPLTPIQVDGGWIADITTGGIDETATRIAAYLVPDGYLPPRMSGGSVLPDELDEIAVAKVEVFRGP